MTHETFEGIETFQQKRNSITIWILTELRFFQIPGGAAKVLNQGSSLTCTCHALANAIADQLNEQNIDVNQKSLADILVNNNKHVEAVWPDIYDNYGEPILVMNENSGKWCSIKIKSVKRVEKFINGKKHLLSYSSERGNHCVFIKEQIEDSYKCVNSWGEYNDPYPVIPVEDANILWTVQVECQPASPSEFMTGLYFKLVFALVELTICIKSF